MKKSTIFFSICTLLLSGVLACLPQLIFAQKSAKGSWSKVYNSDVIPVAVANLPDGRLLAWSSKAKNDFKSEEGAVTYTTIFNPNNNSFSSQLISNTNHNMFCPGISNIGTGEIVVSGGGTSNKTSIYNPNNGSWRIGPDLNVSRGYNAQVTLTNGTVFNLGGSWSGGRANKKAEIYSINGGWRTLTNVESNNTVRQGAPDPEGIYRDDNHAWLWAAPNNRVFQAGPGTEMHWIEANGQGKVINAGKRNDDEYAMNGISIMYDKGKILTCGGAPSYSKNSNASKRAYTINIQNNQPAVNRVNNMKQSRVYHNSVVLPNGEVVVTGGMAKSKIFSDEQARLTAEIWNPSSKKWQEMAAMTDARTYHSVSILMQDGRVWVGGGGLCGDCKVNHPNAQIFTPPYLYNSSNQLADRPVINSAPASANYQSTISVKTNKAISKFSLVRLSSATHSINNEQRRIPLNFSNQGNNNFDVKIPAKNWLPPGYYFLFAIDNNGVPAVAKTIKIGGQTNNNNDQLIANGNYVIQGSNGQQLGAPAFDNDNVRMVNTNNNEDTNTWTFNHISDNVYTIKNVGTENYLEVPFGKCENGSNVATYEGASSDWQKWIISKNGNDFFLQPVHCTSKALDKNNGSGKNVHLWNFSSGNVNQKWQIKSSSNTPAPVTEPPATNGQLVTNGTYLLKATNGQHLGSPANENDNVKMVNADNNQNTNQWIFNHLGNNLYTIKNIGSNRYLEVPFGKCDNGSNVATWKGSSRDWQKWIVSKNGNDFTLQPVHCTSHALDKSNGDSKNAKLWTFSSGNNNQKWEIISVNGGNPRYAAPQSTFEVTPMIKQKTELIWRIMQEEEYKIKQFLVMHVADAYDDFEVIKTIKATNHIGFEEYTFIHKNPEIGENFYQIQIEYEDGTVSNTMYKMVYFEAAPPEIPVTVNQAQNKLKINLSNYLDEAVNYFVSSISGQVLLHGKLSKEHSNIEELDLENFGTGNYVIYLRPENHLEQTQKFVITNNK